MSRVTGNTFEREARLLLQASLLIFSYTVIVGILNGLNIVDFSRLLLLAHLHGGTLGWMTLGILAAALWLFADGDTPSQGSVRVARVLAVVAAGATALFVFSFATTVGALRGVTGTITLLALTGLAVWAFSRARHVVLSVPRLLVLAGLTASVLGGAFGAYVGLAFAFAWPMPGPVYGVHPSTMEIGFVIPVAMGLAEWRLRPQRLDEAASRPGRLQVALMLLAFLVLFSAVLADETMLIGPASGIAVAGLVVFFVRLWPTAIHISPVRRGPQRHALLGGLLVGAAIIYVTVVMAAVQGDLARVPRGQMVAFIHLVAVGGTTNALLAFVISLSRGTGRASVLDDLVFWGLNIGVIGFVVALTADVGWMIMVSASVMGAALLLAIGTHVVALGRRPVVRPPLPPQREEQGRSAGQPAVTIRAGQGAGSPVR